MKSGGGGECNCQCPGGGGCRAGVSAPGQEAGAAPQVWEVESRVAASARSARPPRGLRGDWESVLPARGTLDRVPRGELGAFEGRAERAALGAAETPRGRKVLRDFSGWLLESRT